MRNDMSEAINLWVQVAEDFSARLNAVPAAQLSASTPCAEWDVRGLVTHTIDVQRMIPKALGATGDIDAAIGDDPKAAWATIVAAAKAALTAPGAAGTVVKSPFGEQPAAQALGIPLVDLLVHTWDLARATGGDEKLNPGAVAMALNALTPMDQMLRAPGRFDAKVEVAADADAQTKLIAFTGRKP